MLTKKIVRRMAQKDKALILQFFAVFSRFEYSLKKAGYLKKENGRAEPNWDKFANTLSGRFDTVSSQGFGEAMRFLLAKPPRTQIVMKGLLDWQDTTQVDRETEECYLLRLVRTVRNNLFHGGKQALRDRDECLLKAGITVLEGCLEISPDVSAHFDGSVEQGEQAY